MKTPKTTHFIGLGAAILLIVFLSSFAAGIQPHFKAFLKRSPETRANLITEVMKNRLDLSEEQIEEAFTINQKYAELSQSYVTDTQSINEIPDELFEINQKRILELKEILTSEQLEKAEQVRLQAISRLERLLTYLKENNFINQ